MAAQGTAASIKLKSRDPVSPGVEKTDNAKAVVFDRKGMMARLMGDEALALKVIDGFLYDTPKQIETLKKCLNAGDREGAVRQAHTIKGASAAVGGEAMRAVAYEMEKAGKTGDLPACAAYVSNLESQFARLRKALNRSI